MADEKVFTIRINGVEESHKQVVKLIDVIKKLENSTTSLNKASENRAKVISKETKELENLVKVSEQKAKVDADAAQLEEEVTAKIEERTQQLEKQTEVEIATSEAIGAATEKLGEQKDIRGELTEAEIEAQEVKAALTEQTKLLTQEQRKQTQAEEAGIEVKKQKKKAVKELEDRFISLDNNVNKSAQSMKSILTLFQLGLGLAGGYEKSIAKLGQVLGVVNTIQTISNNLFAKGALLSKESIAMEAIHAVQVRARATAISLATKNTFAASIAQKAFNIVASANPYVLLAMALITVVGALAMFASSTETSSERLARMNDAAAKTLALKEQYANTLKSLSDNEERKLKRELELMKSKGDTEANILKKEEEIHKKRIQHAEERADYYKKEVDDIRKNTHEVSRLTAEIHKLDIDLRVGEVKNMEIYNKKREKLVEDLKETNTALRLGLAAQEDLAKSINDRDKFRSDNDNKYLERSKRNALALAEYRVLEAKKGSEEELKLQKAGALQKMKNDISADGITRGEILKRRKEYHIQIQKLDADYRKQQIQFDIDFIDEKLAFEKEGSAQEYNYKINRLEALKKLELESSEDTGVSKLRIEEKYKHLLDRLDKESKEIQIKNELDTNIALINSRLVAVKKGTEEELQLRADLVKETAELSRESINNSIKNEELKNAKLAEINAKELSDLADISADGELSKLKSKLSEETLAITQEYEARKISKQDYEIEMAKITTNGLTEEIAIRKKNGQDTTDLETKLSNQRMDLNEKEEKKSSETLDTFDKKYNSYVGKLLTKMTDISSKVQDVAKQMFATINQEIEHSLERAKEHLTEVTTQYDEVVKSKEETDKKLADLEERAKNSSGWNRQVIIAQIDQELEAKKKIVAEEQRLAAEKKVAEEEVAKKEKQQKKSKMANDILTAISNTALGATKALNWGFPMGPIFASLLTGLGLFQVNTMRKQLSQLEDGGLLNGKRHSHGGMRVEGTNIEVEGGEYVVNRESTSKNIGLIKYINKERKALTPDDISSFFNAPSNPINPPFKRMLAEGGRLPSINEQRMSDDSKFLDAVQNLKIESTVSVTDINNVQSNMVKVTDWSGIQ